MPNPQSRKRGREGGGGRVHHVPLIFFFKHFRTKTAALHWLAIFEDFHELHMIM